jgi:hypothetical protein
VQYQNKVNRKEERWLFMLTDSLQDKNDGKSSYDITNDPLPYISLQSKTLQTFIS